MQIYINNFSYSTDDAALDKLFSQFGTVTRASICRDKETGASKGFGFIDMTNTREALCAIAALDGCDVGGRTIGVAEARPRPWPRRPKQ